MIRFTLALATCLAFAAATRAADLPAGTWAANVDGTTGDLVVKEIKDGKFTGVLLGADVTGTWDGKTVTFLSGKDTYEAHLVAEPGEKGQTKYTLAGLRSQQVFNMNRAGNGGFNHVAKVGWYAQLTAATPTPKGEIKAEVRGVLVYRKDSAYVLVKRKVGERATETHVWVGGVNENVAPAALAAYDGKEVVVTGTLAQTEVSARANPIPFNSLYFLTGFDIKPATPPK